MLGKGLFNVGGPGESKKGPKLAVNHSPTILSCVSLKKNPSFFYRQGYFCNECNSSASAGESIGENGGNEVA
jgi:hypothetical protein